MAPRRFEYRLVQSQEGRVTFVNGHWAGRVPIEEASRSTKPFESCLSVVDWLQTEGQQGWELVSATVEAAGGQNLTRLYLKRELG
ncbi:hypothetical protein HPC49_38235 [Pyxidicoccus fallax]|uniref:DUF4177 domain-containing protein n=1 Tax=Pyxidicoccus fallax TaxID=394095 RepID=A0A848LKY9_9BACT|nr:hypothetical protein [Pyxidicoccus fallax]NMO18457.1 hypothetical protein [Pyxidicoccus fallax]NPC84041.1 hypothetical protein [Pyxidicoccus fallax]